MTTFHKLCALAVLPLLAVAACGSDDDTGIPESEVAGRLAAAECSKLLTCCNGTAGAPTQQSCTTTLTASIGGSVNTYIADTNISYSSSAAATCLASINAAACGELNTGFTDPSCDEVFTGKIATNGACTKGIDCASTLCVNIQEDNSGNITGPGTCAAQGTSGGACPTNTNGTGDGEFCSSSTYQVNDVNTGACTCVALKANGATCNDGGQCASHECDETNSVCVAATATLDSGTCSVLYSVF